MKRQLQIKNGFARGVWTGYPPMPVPPDASWTFLDVTNRPEAQIGMTYDVNTDTFAPPDRVLSYNEFIQLFTAAERKAFRTLAQTDQDAADLLDLFRTASVIPLKSNRVGNMLSQLVTLGILTPARRLAIINS